jgi:metal-dependent amidase/aminoacylase/carboxypeptidase family protein
MKNAVVIASLFCFKNMAAQKTDYKSVIKTSAEKIEQKLPGLFFFLGGMPKGKDPKTAGPHHTPEFMIEDSSFKTGVIAFCNLVFDYEEMNKK